MVLYMVSVLSPTTAREGRGASKHSEQQMVSAVVQVSEGRFLWFRCGFEMG